VNNTKSSAKAMDGPQQRLATEQRLARAKSRKTRRKWVWVISKRKLYLSFLCIVFSQDLHPRVGEAYR